MGSPVLLIVSWLFYGRCGAPHRTRDLRDDFVRGCAVLESAREDDEHVARLVRTKDETAIVRDFRDVAGLVRDASSFRQARGDAGVELLIGEDRDRRFRRR